MRGWVGWLALLGCAGCGHPWFQSGSGAPAEQLPELMAPTTPDTAPKAYLPGTPSWVPLIDACMRSGRSRGDCIDALPAEQLAELERWERETGAQRRERMLRHRQGEPKFGVEE